MKTEVYEGDGVRFEYPADWTIESTDEDEVTTIDVQHPDGVAFVIVRSDQSRPDPEYVADVALEAMREEYPDLDASPIVETLGEHVVTGHDVEFFSLDVPNAAAIRSFRTPSRTVFLFGQWSELGGDKVPGLVRRVLGAVEVLEDGAP